MTQPSGLLIYCLLRSLNKNFKLVIYIILYMFYKLMYNIFNLYKKVAKSANCALKQNI